MHIIIIQNATMNSEYSYQIHKKSFLRLKQFQIPFIILSMILISQELTTADSIKEKNATTAC